MNSNLIAYLTCGWIIVCLLGCAPSREPVDMSKAQQVKHGMMLTDAEAILGPSHDPSSAQSRHMESMIDKMPPQIKANAVKDRIVAWGNDETLFVALVNSEGKIWATAYNNGAGGPPTSSPPGSAVLQQQHQ